LEKANNDKSGKNQPPLKKDTGTRNEIILPNPKRTAAKDSASSQQP